MPPTSPTMLRPPHEDPVGWERAIGIAQHYMRNYDDRPASRKRAEVILHAVLAGRPAPNANVARYFKRTEPDVRYGHFEYDPAVADYVPVEDGHMTDTTGHPPTTLSHRERQREQYLRGFKRADRYDTATDWDAGYDAALTLAADLVSLVEDLGRRGQPHLVDPLRLVVIPKGALDAVEHALANYRAAGA